MPYRLVFILAVIFALFSAMSQVAFAAEPEHDAAAAPHADAAEHGEHHEGVPLKATPLFEIGSFKITNSMLVTWIVAILIIVAAQTAMRNVKQVPAGRQNFWEWMVESLYNFLESVIGIELVKKTFWFFATIFIFILFLNWFGLIPGVGSIGWGHKAANGDFIIDRPLLRGANADLNLTFAMATVFFALWIVWAVQANDIGGVFKHIFGAKGESKGFMALVMALIFFMVGLLEIVSILF